MDKYLWPGIKDDLDLAAILQNSRDADAESWVVQNVTRRVIALWRIAFRECHILSFQEPLIMANPHLRLRSRDAARFALAHFSRRSAWLVRFVSVLRITRVAVHSRWFIPDHGFDRVRQDEFALAAPAINVPARLQHGFSPVHCGQLLSGFNFHRIHMTTE